MSRVKLLDPVALLADRPDLGLVRGQLGTAVLQHAADIWEVEFDDSNGRTFQVGGIAGIGIARPAHSTRRRLDPLHPARRYAALQQELQFSGA